MGKIGQRIMVGVLGVLMLGFVNTGMLVKASLAVGEVNKVCEELRGAEDVDQSVLDAAGCSGPTGSNRNIPELITTLINVAISIVGIISVGALVIAGQRYIVSAGDAAKVAQAKKMITYAVVALGVAFLAFAIVRFVTVSIGA